MINNKIHKTNVISSTAKIGNNVSIGAFNVIEDNVIIGDNVKIGNFIVYFGCHE